MQTDLHPNPARPQQLLTELVAFFASLDAVSGVEVFGSLADDRWDRWSDVDLIVVTGHRAQFRMVFDQLRAHKPVFYHDPFTYVGPCSGRVLGIGFEDESIFHHLDLNFFTLTNYHTAGALDRFGTRQQLFVSNRHEAPNGDYGELPAEGKRPLDQLVDEVENKELVIATHFTKKTAKRILRGGEDRDNLRTWSDRLRAALQHVSADRSPGLLHLARGYLQIAEAVFEEDTSM